MIKKVKGGYAIAHCRGKNRGKIVKGSKNKSKARVAKMHRAIMRKKKKKKKAKKGYGY